ncbi:MAG: glutathione-disulfide reductase [Planctomycetota bacterium]|jgi:glutathione reductase (NADPH)|nr:glutathione-disulfide reductase [Deltaproteobacteria bacterium]MDP6539861.1 glutathione-disulfide reductase [Planctomycetota bacterium]
MSDRDFDLFVLGAGSGGVRASRVSAGYGARVAVAEDDRLGGTCVNVGCIPKKLLVLASHYSEDFEDARAYGWDVEARGFDWARLIANKDGEIQRLNGVYQRLLDEAGVTRIEGFARLEDEHTVRVGERSYSAETILVATGSWPHMPAIPGIEHAISSNEAFYLDRLPERVAVVGGGYIGVEFAGIFHGLGARTTQLYRGPLFLRGFDDDLRRTLAEEMEKKGIDLRFETDPTAIERKDDGLHLTLNDGSSLVVDEVLYATGRLPKTRDLGLEKLGVEMGPKGEIKVDATSRTNVPSIYAIGDATDRLNLTPVALAEGMAFARTVYGGEPTQPDHADVATAVFSQPPIGTVGLTESEAREQLGPVDVYRSSFKPLKHTLTGRDEKTLMKLLVDPRSDRVVGAHMIGADAPEILQAVGIAVKLCATKAQFDATIGIHPTAAEEFVTMREKASS